MSNSSWVHANIAAACYTSELDGWGFKGGSPERSASYFVHYGLWFGVSG